MSKSLGNSIEPQEIIKESGAEIIRLWVAMVDFREEVRVGKQILARVIEAYRKIRNTLRYLASNLYDFDPAADRIPLESDAGGRQVRARALRARPRLLCSRAYEDYDFPTIFQAINQFTTVDLSAFYADVSKDRLYTFAAASPERRSAQTAMYIIADGLARLLAPILPMTTDELWRHLPGTARRVVHLAEFPAGGRQAARRRPGRDGGTRLMRIRDEVNRALEAERKDKTIGNSLGGERYVCGRAATTAALLEQYREELPMLLIVSQVDAGHVDSPAMKLPRRGSSLTSRDGREMRAVLADRRDLYPQRRRDRRAVRPVRRRAAGDGWPGGGMIRR